MAATPPRLWASPIPTITAFPVWSWDWKTRFRQAAGGKVATSIDMRVQYILAHEVQAARQTFTAHAAGGIVMDVNTGEVLAMVSLPDFDPNQRRLGKDDSSRNIMAQDVYELGSVFKIFTFALALEDHTLRSLDEVFPIGQGYKIGKHTIHEAEHMPATLAARDILAQSSNIGTLQIALRSGPTRQRAFLGNLGLLKPLKAELPETARPLYPRYQLGPDRNRHHRLRPGHFGQPAQLRHRRRRSGQWRPPHHARPSSSRMRDLRGEQVIKPETSGPDARPAALCRDQRHRQEADVAGYDVGGKTGSAQVPGPHGGYIPHALRTAFCGVFPVHNPRYMVFVLLDQPHGTKETGGFALAGYTAAPLAGRVISRIAPLLGVPNTAAADKIGAG